MNREAIYLLMLIISVTALTGAYIAEKFYGLFPCPLCVYQRFPYLILIYLSLIAISDADSKSNTGSEVLHGAKAFPSYLRIYPAVTLLAAILIAAYHTWIERNIFTPGGFCKPAVMLMQYNTPDDFKNFLMQEKNISCSKPAVVIFGLSMTEWNLILNLLLSALFLLTMLLSKKLLPKMLIPKTRG